MDMNMIQNMICTKAHFKWSVARWKTVLWLDELKFDILF